MKLTIDRKRWLRGRGAAMSALLTEEGKMCCLGFFGVALGIDPNRLMNAKSPATCNHTEWPAWLTESPGGHVMNTDLCARLMAQNDTYGSVMTEAKRERLIAADFALNGIEVEFVG